MVEATKGLCQRYVNGATDNCFFCSWFDLNRLVESEMDVSTDIIVMVKTNRKVFCRDKIDKL